MEQREYIVEAEGAGQRIDRFLSGEDTGLSRSALQGLVAEGHVLCNGKAPAKSLKLKAGDIILLEIPDAKPIEAVPQEIPLDIIYEDAHLLVVNKPKRAGRPPGSRQPGRHAGERAAVALQGKPVRYWRRDSPRHRAPHR